MSAPAFIRIRVEGFEPPVNCHPGESFLDAAGRAGLLLATACGGEGRCRSCAVRVSAGARPEIQPGEADMFSPQQLEMGWRRACRMVPTADCTVYVPRRALNANIRHLVSGEGFAPLPVDPLIRTAVVRLPTNGTTAADNWKYFEKYIDTHKLQVDIDVLRELDTTLYQQKGRIKIFLRGDDVIGTGARGSRAFGVAIDLGTTNIAAFLINLNSGATLAAITAPNPQARFGGDVITRLNRAIHNEADRLAMRELVVTAINGLIAELCANAMGRCDQVVDLVIAGNTAMHHLFTGLPLTQLGKAPFIPATRRPMDIKARDLGLKVAAGAYVHLPAIIAGYVGSDHSTALLSCAGTPDPRLGLLVDIGTNTEISLIEAGRITSASCPSGPALEGGQISCGMPALEGAIEAIEINGSQVRLKTIGDTPPVGLCGSGVLDMLAQLLQGGVVNHRGRLDKTHPRVVAYGGRLEFVLLRDGPDGRISFSQDDIRAVQLAKAAIRAGIDLLLETMGRQEDDIARVMVTGAFGSHINLESAIAIGLLPRLPVSRFSQVGNAAGQGARLALTSAANRAKAAKLASRAAYIELAGRDDFMRAFIGRINFAKPAAARHKQDKDP